jgi:hypothetical protein
LKETKPFVDRFISLIVMGKSQRRGLSFKKKEVNKLRTFNLLLSEGSMLLVIKIK